MKFEFMKPLVVLFLISSGLFAQAPLEKKPNLFRLIYVDRPPTGSEIAAAEASDTSIEPVIYYFAPQIDRKAKQEFLPLALPIMRITNPISLPPGETLRLYSKPDPTTKFAEVVLNGESTVVALLRASRDKAFQDARVEVLDASSAVFPYGQMRIVNTTDQQIAVRAGNSIKRVDSGGVVTCKPTPVRRDTVPVLIQVEEGGIWHEIHSGATKVRSSNRVMILVANTTTASGKSLFSVEYLVETKPETTE